jgi:hypothetical protein
VWIFPDGFLQVTHGELATECMGRSQALAQAGVAVLLAFAATASRRSHLLSTMQPGDINVTNPRHPLGVDRAFARRVRDISTHTESKRPTIESVQNVDIGVCIHLDLDNASK